MKTGNGQIAIYQTDDGQVQFEVALERGVQFRRWQSSSRRLPCLHG